MNPAALRALDLFDQIVVLSGAARRRALADLAVRDPDAHEVLARLLTSDSRLTDDAAMSDIFHAIPEGTLFQEGDDNEVADARLGQRLGPWRITGILGTGGMGTVYEAERDDGQYHQRVALKCIRGDLSEPRVIESFRRERAILAELDHPGIVPVMDGGIDGSGQPWFAMRYVEGAPIDVWCDHRFASVRERVALLLQVCEALDYAHASGVLHQDIKPSNLLVTDAGQVQLLDFGLSVSLTGSPGAQRLALSHAYTAPEALSVAAPAISGDIWSLGMVMYRLLTGELPHVRSHMASLVGGTPGADAPVLMSRLAAHASEDDARRRGCRNTAVLAQRLSHDLDAIALRCIAARPEERYDSVRRLHADLRAWLEVRPVEARAGGVRYRTARFLARHRLSAGLAALLVLSTAIGLGAIAWKQRNDTRSAQAMQSVAAVLEQTLGVATLSGLGETPMSSHALLQESERRMRALTLDQQPEAMAQGLAMLARNYAVLGDYPRATALAREATALQGKGAHATRSQATLAALLNLQGKPAEAASLALTALETLDSDDTSLRPLLLTELARAHWHLADHRQARQRLDEALDIARRAGDAAAEAELLTQRAQWNIRLLRFAEAASDTQAAIALPNPSSPLLAYEAQRISAHNLVMQERLPEARRVVETLLKDYRALLGDDHPLVGRTWRVYGGQLCSSGELEACADALDRAERIILRYYGADHPEYAELLQVRALMLGLDGKRKESVALLRRSESLLEAAYPPDHNAVQHVRFMVARRLLYWPDVSDAHRAAQLDEVVRRLDAVQASFARGGLPLRPLDRITLADALEARKGPGDLARARRALDDNVATLRAYPPTYSVYYRNDYDRARLAYLADDLAMAGRVLAPLTHALERDLAQPGATATGSALSSDNNRRTLSLVRALRAALLARQGANAEARTLLQQSIEDLRPIQRLRDSYIADAEARLATFDRTGAVTVD